MPPHGGRPYRRYLVTLGQILQGIYPTIAWLGDPDRPITVDAGSGMLFCAIAEWCLTSLDLGTWKAPVFDARMFAEPFARGVVTAAFNQRGG